MMNIHAFLCVAALGVTADDALSQKGLLEIYRVEAEKAGRDPDAHTRLALWCELNGLAPEKLKHLARAVLIDPKHALARSLLGYLREGESWRKPGEPSRAGDEVESAIRAEYEKRRSQTPRTGNARWKLGLWCESRRLTAEAMAHFTEVTRLSPGDSRAWKKLGCVNVGGIWLSRDELASLRKEVKAQTDANRAWMPRVAEWAVALGSKDEQKREQAKERLLAITDPRAVPALLRALGSNMPEANQFLATVLGQVEAAASSRALAGMAVFAEDAETRRLATETIRRRDIREFGEPLVRLVRTPLRYEVKPIGGPGTEGILFVEGQEYNLRKRYQVRGLPAFMPARPLGEGEVLVRDEFGLPYAMRLPGTSTFTQLLLEAGWAGRIVRNADTADDAVSRAMRWGADSQLSWVGAGAGGFGFTAGDPFLSWRGTPTETVRSLLGPQQRAQLEQVERNIELMRGQMARDIAEIEATNVVIRQTNERVLPVLQAAAGVDLGIAPEAWQDWYGEQIGGTFARSTQKPTVDQFVAYQPVIASEIERPFAPSGSCFGAGTLVHTKGGTRAIETVQGGDLVLSQQTTTGALSYQPVLVAHHNRPSPTLLLALDSGETITTSLFHRFWVAGRGWVVARDLKAGDRVRSLSGLSAVKSLDPGDVQPVYNLEVAENHTFFVGTGAALVYDFTIPALTDAVPFDAVAVGAPAADPSERSPVSATRR
jgi:hypothetical protein